MKQFSLLEHGSGKTWGPYSLKEIAALGVGPRYQHQIDALGVGESCLDFDRDMWTRLPDIADESSPAQTRVERRERIATAVLAGLLANPKRTGRISDFAEDATVFADALIAELDKTE